MQQQEPPANYEELLNRYAKSLEDCSHQTEWSRKMETWYNQLIGTPGVKRCHSDDYWAFYVSWPFVLLFVVIFWRYIRKKWSQIKKEVEDYKQAKLNPMPPVDKKSSVKNNSSKRNRKNKQLG